MGKDTITQRTYGMSISDEERDALAAHIGAGICALELDKDLPDKLVFGILNGLATIQKTYQEITMLAFNTDYAQLIVDTLKAFYEKGYSGTYEYNTFLKTVTKLIEDMMIAISFGYREARGSNLYYEISESYDKLLNLEHKIDSNCILK